MAGVRLDEDAPERVEVGIPAEPGHSPDRAIQ